MYVFFYYQAQHDKSAFTVAAQPILNRLPSTMNLSHKLYILSLFAPSLEDKGEIEVSELLLLFRRSALEPRSADYLGMFC